MLCHFRSVFCASVLGASLMFLGANLALAQNGKKSPPPPPPTFPYSFTSVGQPAYASGGTLKAYNLTEPNELDELLIVGGGTATPSPAFATVWEATASGGLLGVNAVPDSMRGAAAVNNDGVIAFYGYSSAQDANSGMVYIPGVGQVEFPLADFRPQAINNRGQVVGVWSNFVGFLWNVREDGTSGDIITLRDFFPQDINDWGVMAGRQVSTSTAAIAWIEAGELVVRPLPGHFASNKGLATGINNFGEVVGFSSLVWPSSGGKPFFWSPTDGLVSLNPKAETGAALDINDRGQVVGWSIDSSYYAFLWEKGELSNLNDLSGVATATFRLGTAEAINNAGQIVGRSSTYGKYKGGSIITGNATYLLTPKP